MTYLLLALVVLTIVALLVAPRSGLLLLFSTTGLLAYEYAAARYILLAIVALNVLIVLVLVSAVLHSRIRARKTEENADPESSDDKQAECRAEENSPPADR